MEHISISAIHRFVEVHAIWAYIILYLGVIVEGEVVVILAGIFSFLGSINLFIAFAAVILGGVTKSILGYTIGYYLNKHHSHKPIISKIERRISYFLPRFKDKPFWSIFISRFFLLGIGWFTLVFSGYKNTAVKLYAKAEAFSLVLWTIGFLALGHFFGYTALSISRDVRKVLILILVFFILFFILEKVIAFIVELFTIKDFDEYED